MIFAAVSSISITLLCSLTNVLTPKCQNRCCSCRGVREATHFTTKAWEHKATYPGSTAPPCWDIPARGSGALRREVGLSILYFYTAVTGCHCSRNNSADWTPKLQFKGHWCLGIREELCKTSEQPRRQTDHLWTCHGEIPLLHCLKYWGGCLRNVLCTAILQCL